MGIEQSTYKGHRSKHGSVLYDQTVDYKDPRFMKRAKNELYDLFQQDKIVHREVIMDLDKEFEAMEKELKALSSENRHLKEQLQKYQELNRVNTDSTSSKSAQPPPGTETKKPIKDPNPDKKEDDTSSEEDSDDENKKELKDKLKNLARKIKQIKKLRESRSRKDKDNDKNKTEPRLRLEHESEDSEDSDESDESD